MREVSILIVDDTATARNLVRSTLQNHFGTETILTAANGREALDILRQNRVDIIISDWNMPVMTGEEFLYEVRQNPATKKTPFIMMTSNEDRDFIVTAIQLGVTNYIIKPFTPHELNEKIRSAWGFHWRRREDRHAYLPKHQVKVIVDGKTTTGEFLDISQTGALIKLSSHPSLTLFKVCELRLELIDPAGIDINSTVIDSLYGMIVRLEAENSFHPADRMCRMGLYFNPGTMRREVSAELGKFIKWLAGRTPELIGQED